MSGLDALSEQAQQQAWERLCSQIARIPVINTLRTVPAEVVEAARENLVIGPLTGAHDRRSAIAA